MKNNYIIRPIDDKQFPWGVFDISGVTPEFVGRFLTRGMAEGIVASLGGRA
jgi:hypothetical protein